NGANEIRSDFSRVDFVNHFPGLVGKNQSAENIHAEDIREHLALAVSEKRGLPLENGGPESVESDDDGQTAGAFHEERSAETQLLLNGEGKDSPVFVQAAVKTRRMISSMESSSMARSITGISARSLAITE